MTSTKVSTFFIVKKMHPSQKAFYKNKNSRTPPGWHFDINHQFMNQFGNLVPINTSSMSWSYEKHNDEPAHVTIETVKKTPQGTIRKKKNFEIDRHNRVKHKPHKHVKFDLDDPNAGKPKYEDYSDEEEEELSDEAEGLQDEINEEMKEKITDEDEPEADEADEEVDELAKALRKKGFSKYKIDLVRKMIYDILE